MCNGVCWPNAQTVSISFTRNEIRNDSRVLFSLSHTRAHTHIHAQHTPFGINIVVWFVRLVSVGRFCSNRHCVYVSLYREIFTIGHHRVLCAQKKSNSKKFRPLLHRHSVPSNRYGHIVSSSRINKRTTVKLVENSSGKNEERRISWSAVQIKFVVSSSCK